MVEELRRRHVTTKDGFLLILRGVNFNPGSEYKWAFLIVTLILIAIASLLIRHFQRIKWL
jgi:hypothetical protein